MSSVPLRIAENCAVVLLSVEERRLLEVDDGAILECRRVTVLDRASFRRSLGARILPEVVVEGPVLLDEEDHVLDR